MKAYRYFSLYGLETLRDKRFKLAKPSELNDPFDCVLAYSGQPSRATALEAVIPFVGQLEANKASQGISLEEIKQQHDAEVEKYVAKYQNGMIDITTLNSQNKRAADKAIRLLCVSAKIEDMTPDDQLGEVLLWSHYADKHRGVRIGLDLELLRGHQHLNLCPVNYSASPPMFDLSQEMTREVFLTTVRTKSPAWSYENELRLWSSPEHCLESTLENGMLAHFLQFTPDVIWRVDFGLRMSSADQDKCLEILALDYPHVEVYKAQQHPTQYALRYERVKLTFPKQSLDMNKRTRAVTKNGATCLADMPDNEQCQTPDGFVITRRSLIVAGSIVVAVSMAMSAIVAVSIGIWGNKCGSPMEDAGKQSVVQTANKLANQKEASISNSATLAFLPSKSVQVYTSAPPVSVAVASTSLAGQKANATTNITLNLSPSSPSIHFGESFTLTIEVSGADRGIVAPDLSALPPSDVLFLGQHSNSHSSITIINGRMTRESFDGRVFSYQITPQSKGAYHTGPVRVIAAGKTYSHPGIPVEVAGGPEA